MKLINILFAQAIRLFPLYPVQGRLHGPQLARAFEAKYSFIEGPRTVEAFDLSKGVHFRHGYFRTGVIDKFSLFTDGVVCEAKIDADVLEEFIDDALAWASAEGGLGLLSETYKAGRRAYSSRVDVEAEVELKSVVALFQQLGGLIAKTIASYGKEKPASYELAGIHLHVDNTAKPSGEAMAPFSFERLVSQPYSLNRWFSSAPLKTKDHLRLLDELERSLQAIRMKSEVRI